MLFTNPFQNRNSDANRDRKSKVQRRQTQRSSARRSSFSPRFEPLENRAMLSAISVVNLDDRPIGEDPVAGSLRAAIVAANESPGEDVITFDVKGTVTLTGGELQITDDLTIDGPGQNSLIVSGGGSTRVFHVMNTETEPDVDDVTDVEINHLTIADGFVTGVTASATGGGVLVDGGSALGLHHVTVANNHANANQDQKGNGQGGGIHVGSGGELDVVHGTFTGNQATGNRHSFGGAIRNDGTLNVNLSTFTDNQSRTNTLDESGEFDRHCDNAAETNFCTSNGGAIANGAFATTTVTHSSFVGNEAIGTATIPGRHLNAGGAIDSTFASTVIIDKSYFRDNSASSLFLANGGAIHHVFAFLPGAGTTVTDSTFVANHVTADVVASGGAIHFAVGINADNVVEGSRFIANTATAGVLARGGAISHSNSGTAHIVGSQFVGNSAHSDGLEFEGITPGAFGGAIANYDGATTTVDSSSIVNNEAMSGGDGKALGGGIFNDFDLDNNGEPRPSSFTLTRSNVNANRASDGIGGGVYNAEGGTFEIDKKSKVRGNKATSNDNVFGNLTLLEEVLTDAMLL